MPANSVAELQANLQLESRVLVDSQDLAAGEREVGEGALKLAFGIVPEDEPLLLFVENAGQTSWSWVTSIRLA